MIDKMTIFILGGGGGRYSGACILFGARYSGVIQYLINMLYE